MKAVIFDLDGTLIDSLDDIALSMNLALKQLNYKTYEINEYKLFLGEGAMKLSQNVLAYNATQDEILGLFNKFNEIYASKIFNNTSVYKGIYDLLDNLKRNNFEIAILSNKPDSFTQDYVKKYFSNYCFKIILGQKDSIPKKPNPRAAKYIAKEFGLNEKDIYFIGDTSTDIRTAKNAGMISVGVLWGFRGKQEFINEKADYIVENISELKNLLLAEYE